MSQEERHLIFIFNMGSLLFGPVSFSLVIRADVQCILDDREQAVSVSMKFKLTCG